MASVSYESFREQILGIPESTQSKSSPVDLGSLVDKLDSLSNSKEFNSYFIPALALFVPFTKSPASFINSAADCALEVKTHSRGRVNDFYQGFHAEFSGWAKRIYESPVLNADIDEHSSEFPAGIVSRLSNHELTMHDMFSLAKAINPSGRYRRAVQPYMNNSTGRMGYSLVLSRLLHESIEKDTSRAGQHKISAKTLYQFSKGANRDEKE